MGATVKRMCLTAVVTVFNNENYLDKKVKGFDITTQILTFKRSLPTHRDKQRMKSSHYFSWVVELHELFNIEKTMLWQILRQFILLYFCKTFDNIEVSESF